jgi:hypothetical protein
VKPEPKQKIATKVKPQRVEMFTAPLGKGPPALVIGGGECVWDDVRRLEEMLGMEWPWTVIAVNDVGCHWPRKIDHWCTLHPEKLPAWMELRKRNKHPDGYVTWTRENRIRRTKSGDIATTHRKTPTHPFQGGASGLLAVAVAYEIGARTVALCGVPMTNTPHFKESTVHKSGKNWPGSHSHLRAWGKPAVLGKLKGRVCSMAGETKKLLGECYPCLFLDCDKAAA